MKIGKQLWGYRCRDVNEYLESRAQDERKKLAALEQQLIECRSKNQELFSEIEQLIKDLDSYYQQDRLISNRVLEQVRMLEEVRHQTAAKISQATDLAGDKLKRLQDFYILPERIRSQIGSLCSELADAGGFGSFNQPNQAAKDIVGSERGVELEV